MKTEAIQKQRREQPQRKWTLKIWLHLELIAYRL